MKQATTIEQQIALLEDRGMNFIDKDKAREILSDKGYYRMGFYWFPFEKTYPKKNNRSHSFRTGTSFENVVSLYYFDRDLRSTIADYLYRIEINFRTKIIYTVSNFYSDNPLWFIDKNVIAEDFISSLPTIYSGIKKNETNS